MSEEPFDSTRKRMSVLRKDGVLYVKGAFETVVPLCIAGTESAADANALTLRVRLGYGEVELPR